LRHLAVLIALTLLAPAPLAAQEGQPNIVLVFMDNFGWGEPGFNGGGIIRGAPTPRLDRLADEGLRLTNFNVEVQCTPSRSALMTGRYGIRSGNASIPLGTGVYGLVQWEITLAEALSDAGYRTGMFGKWHLGRTPGRYPTDQGFDEWYGIPNSTDESTWSSLEFYDESVIPLTDVYEGRKGEQPTAVRPYTLEYRPLIDKDLTDRAIDFMRRSREEGRPFFVYLPYTATHFPTLPHPDFRGSTGKGAWADLLAQIDAYTGRLLDAVEELGIQENTIFIFTADNGPESGARGGTNLTVETAIQGTAGPWRGTLFTGYEGALRVPFVIRWPGRVSSGSSSDEIVHAMDLFPTLLRIAGGEVPDDRVIDGVDQTDFLLGNRERSSREGFVVYVGNEIFAVKWRNWKVHFKEMDRFPSVIREYDLPRVYDLLADPGETNNVLFPNTWVTQGALPQLEEHLASFAREPRIAPGAPDPYEPSR
jgi:arylsulfatase